MAPAEILHESWNCRCALACPSQHHKVRILRQPASIRVKGQSALNTLVRIVCFAEGADPLRAFFVRHIAIESWALPEALAVT